MKKLVVITGATQGIGRALAEGFAAQGLSLALCARTQKDLMELAEVLRDRFPEQEFLTVRADVSKKDEVLGFAKMIGESDMPVKVLINNAGVFLPGQVHSEEEGALEQQIETNLYSAYHLTRALLPSMMEARQGHIFNMCSTASITAYTNGGSYAISKFAMLGLTKVLREEMKPHNIRVTAVLPGATFTNSWAGVDLPEERFMSPKDVADVVINAYQLSDRSVVEEILLRPQLGDLG